MRKLNKIESKTKMFFSKMNEKFEEQFDAWVDYAIEHPIAYRILWFSGLFGGLLIRYWICKKTNRNFITGFKEKNR